MLLGPLLDPAALSFSLSLCFPVCLSLSFSKTVLLAAFFSGVGARPLPVALAMALVLLLMLLLLLEDSSSSSSSSSLPPLCGLSSARSRVGR